jgi:prepilin-type N-terminal cleavage/methylation domain-containing protein
MQFKKNIKNFNNKGFTIPEVLIVITISALIVVTIASIIVYSQKSYLQSGNSAEIAQNARVILERMSREIRQAVKISTQLPVSNVNPANEIQFQDGHLPVVLESVNAEGGNSNNIVLSSGSSSLDNYYKDLYIKIISGVGAGQVRRITSYNGASKTAEVNQSWTTNPSVGSLYKIDSSFYYIRYHLDGQKNILREVFVYCFSQNYLTCTSPETYVSFGSVPPPGQALLKVPLESDEIIGQYITALQFYGQNTINIFLSLQINNQITSFQTEVYGRNL